MNLQLGFGLAGAAVGLLVGIIGGLISAASFGIVIFRSLLSALIAGLVALLVYMVIKKFLPELLMDQVSETEEPSAPGSRLDINIQDSIDIPSQRSENDTNSQDFSEASYAEESSDFGDDVPDFEPASDQASGEKKGIIEELKDQIPIQLQVDNTPEKQFSEDAFYSGISHLPDIGNFSDQFAQADDSIDDVLPTGPSNSGGGKKSNMDPELIAQAIRTALTKDAQ